MKRIICLLTLVIMILSLASCGIFGNHELPNPQRLMFYKKDDGTYMVSIGKATELEHIEIPATYLWQG